MSEKPSNYQEGVLERLRREALEEQARNPQGAPEHAVTLEHPHRYREHWINVAHVARVEHMRPTNSWPSTLMLTFDNPAAMHEALEALCTGREVNGGGTRHDTGRFCPVHPDHDDR